MSFGLTKEESLVRLAVILLLTDLRRLYKEELPDSPEVYLEKLESSVEELKKMYDRDADRKTKLRSTIRVSSIAVRVACQYLLKYDKDK